MAEGLSLQHEGDIAVGGATSGASSNLTASTGTKDFSVNQIQAPPPPVEKTPPAIIAAIGIAILFTLPKIIKAFK